LFICFGAGDLCGLGKYFTTGVYIPNPWRPLFLTKLLLWVLTDHTKNQNGVTETKALHHQTETGLPRTQEREANFNWNDNEVPYKKVI
jgi:hypothetical protein